MCVKRILSARNIPSFGRVKKFGERKIFRLFFSAAPGTVTKNAKMLTTFLNFNPNFFFVKIFLSKLNIQEFQNWTFFAFFSILKLLL